MDHYYSAHPTSQHEYRQIRIKVRGVDLALETDAGVFSKGRLDTGTKLLIEALPLETNPGQLLDLGPGYGPIGLTLARLLPEAKVYLTDINERAAELCRHNAQKNGLTNVEIRCGHALEPVGGLQFDLIVTNPPIRAGKEVIYQMVNDSLRHLNQGGQLVLVALTRQGAKSLAKKMEATFGNVRELAKGSGYRVLGSVKEYN